jgi:hypothetical protein
VNLLVLSASVVVLLGFCWLLSLLARSARSGTPITWRDVAITAALFAAAAGLIVYMVR